MGVRRLWQVSTFYPRQPAAIADPYVTTLKLVKPAGRIRSLAEMAFTEGFEVNAFGHRGFRVGIDASIWLFHTQWSREGQNPELRMLFYRCCKQLMEKGILPVFVFDGCLRPQEKRGKRVISREFHWLVAPFKQMLEAFGFEWRMAPGEAEAELALMSQRGYIDAVWTDDADALVFGATKVIRNLSPRLAGNVGNPKLQDGNHTVVYTADDIRSHRQIYLTHGGLILVALLSGGDYLPAGLPNCGPETSHGLALCGFGDELLRAARDLDDDGLNNFLILWRHDIRQELRTNGSQCLPSKSPAIAASLTDNFPSVSLVRLYTNPVTSESDPTYHIEPPSWSRELDVGMLGRFCEAHFEWGTRDTIRDRFRNILHDGLIIRFLRRSTIDRDMNRPLHPLALLCETVLTKIITDRRNPATDNLHEYGVRISPAQLDDLATRRLLGSRQPLDTSLNTVQHTPSRFRPYMSARARSKPTSAKRLAASLQVWVPAAMLSEGFPNLVHDFEVKKAREEKKDAKRLQRISHRRVSVIHTASSTRSHSSIVTPAAQGSHRAKSLFTAKKKTPVSRRTKSKGGPLANKSHEVFASARSDQRKTAADYASSGEDSEVELPRNPFTVLRSLSRPACHKQRGTPSRQSPSFRSVISLSGSESDPELEPAATSLKSDTDVIYVSDSSDTAVPPGSTHICGGADIIYVSSDSDN